MSALRTHYVEISQHTDNSETTMTKTFSALILAAFAAVSFNASAASHAGAPMTAASAPAAKASAHAKDSAHKKEAKPAKGAASAAAK